MEGYGLLTREQYALVYGLTAAVLLIALIGTVLSLWSFGGLLWWPAFALAAVVLALEAHSFYSRNL